uniref:phospholipase DDHD1-like n=1 Tax=Styela clava TaxID=7725 RepID=UPI00193A8E3B|nr:phospholipase DDHD1-like [Styela clava]
MSINNDELPGVKIPTIVDEEFEDIVELDNAAVSSTNALLPNAKQDFKELQRSSSRYVEKVEGLNVEEVRWFYQSVKKKKWKPFNGNDSISIESEWRCVSRSDSEIKRVCVRGGMYEVDVLDRKCYPVYWSSFNLKGVEEAVDILRGTWFYGGSYIPLDEILADKIEANHIERWKDCSLDEVKKAVGSTAMHSVKLENCHVDWYSVNDIYIHSDAVSYRALRNIVQKFGASKTSTSGNKLQRGYCEEAAHEDCTPPVEHLVFVVHGIGAKSDRHKIVRNTNAFRVTCDRVAAKHFAHYTGRVEFLPVEWRSKLVLDDGIVDILTPKKGQGLRQFLNNNAMDILYYTSPLYRAEIVNGLHRELLRLHRMFMERNPDFAGKISIFAHSLGSVIMHDIMTGWSPESLFEEYLKKQNENNFNIEKSEPDLMYFSSTESFENELTQFKKAKEKIANIESHVLYEKEPKKGLGFVVENFFCVGSPLAVFLSLRGQRPSNASGTQDDIIPRNVCRRIFNIYHPSDPVAYRFEPLIVSHYSSISPLQVHWHNAVHKTPYIEMRAKPYSSEANKELVKLSEREPSIDTDGTSIDLSDTEDPEDSKNEFFEKDTELEDNESLNSGNGPVSSPDIERRSSYLKAISGGAFRVGKALLGRARGSSSPNLKSVDGLSLNSSPPGEEDLSEIKDSIPVTDYEESVSIACSTELQKEKNMNSHVKTRITEPDIQSDTVSNSSLGLELRLDYELQEGFTESRLGYASITSHTSYWNSQDVALFVLMQIHPPSAMTQNIRP